MGWGNGQVDYGPAPIYGGGVIYAEDDRMINALRKENEGLVKFLDKTIVSRRAWVVVAYNLGKTGKKKTPEELDCLYAQAKKLCNEQAKKKGIQKFLKETDIFDLKM